MIHEASYLLSSTKKEQNNFKTNVNTMWKTKTPSELASLMESPLNFMCFIGKKIVNVNTPL